MYAYKQNRFCEFNDKNINIIKSRITLLAPLVKKEEPDSATGLKAKDEALISSNRSSLLLSGADGINMELLLLAFGINGNFPVVGEG